MADKYERFLRGRLHELRMEYEQAAKPKHSPLPEDLKVTQPVRDFQNKSILNVKRIRYFCPDCGTGGAHPYNLPSPLCHVCNYKVTMKPK